MGTFNVSRVPSQIVDNVIKVADVCQAMLMRNSRETEKNVMLQSVGGKTTMINRTTLAKSFVTLEGKPIKILRLRYDKKYTVMHIQKTDCLAVHIPASSKSVFKKPDGSVVKHGTVMVIPAKDVDSSSGYIDMSNAEIISDKLFKKIYTTVKFSDAIQKRIDEVLTEKKTVGKAKDVEKVADNSSFDAGDSIKKASEWNEEPRKVVQQTPVKPSAAKVANAETPSGKAVMAVASVVDNTGKTVGYRLRAANGQEKIYNLREVAIYAMQGKIGNVKFVRSDNGGYLAGINCSLKELPSEPC